MLYVYIVSIIVMPILSFCNSHITFSSLAYFHIFHIFRMLISPAIPGLCQVPRLHFRRSHVETSEAQDHRQTQLIADHSHGTRRAGQIFGTPVISVISHTLQSLSSGMRPSHKMPKATKAQPWQSDAKRMPGVLESWRVRSQVSISHLPGHP